MKKTVLITGASRGIGKSTAIKFAQNGFNVVINYNNSEKEAYLLSKYLKDEYNSETLVIKADVSNEKEVEKMIDLILNKFTKIDVLVNNAGIAFDCIFEDKTVENFQKILNVNLLGTFLVSKYVSNNMILNRQGRIINISSTNGIDTYYPYSLDYDASKAGVISLTHNFSKQLAPYINVNCVCPGWVLTEMNKDMDIEFYNNEKEKINLKRFANPEEIANVIYFLSTDDASYINGAIIPVDGGK